MRKAVYTIIMIIGWLGVSGAQTETRPDGERERLIGPVKSLLINRVESPGQPRRKAGSYDYDSRGNLTRSVVYRHDGATATKLVLAYNDQGTKTEQVRFISKDVLVSRTLYSHDAAGRIIEADEYDEKKTLRLKTLFSYDEGGRLIESKHMEGHDIAFRISYMYNADSKLSEQVNSNKEGVVQFKAAHLYESDLIRSEYIVYRDPHASPAKTIRIHDLKKGSTEIAYYRSSGDLAWKWVFTSDDKGNVIGEEFSNLAAPDKWSYKYEYDPIGNWIKRTTSRWHPDGKKLEARSEHTIHREITYHPQPYSPVKGSIANSEEQPVERVTGGIVPEAPITRVPESPLRALGSRSVPRVLLEAWVDEEGNVASAKAKAGALMFGKAAEKAVKNWRFKPALVSGVPTKVLRLIRVDLP